MIATGQVLNDTYEVISRLGSGGGGIIYKAYHKRMKKYVAIKLIKDNIKGEINSRSEVDSLKDLKHEFLPQVIDFVEDGDDVYTVMEFIEGKNFKQLIEEGRTFDERLVRKFALQLCSAVQYLHSQEPPVIHSDIKPANVMLTPKGNICLIDFNISVFSGNGIGTAMGGSRGFAAPEQFRRIIDAPVFIDEFHEETRFIDSDETEILLASEQLPRQTSGIKTRNTALAYIDTRTDIYGIGSTLYYFLTSRIPINGHTDFRGISCSKEIKNIIAKAMDPSPGKRYQSAAEMRRALMVRPRKIPKAALIAAASLLTALICVITVLSFGSADIENDPEINMDRYAYHITEASNDVDIQSETTMSAAVNNLTETSDVKTETEITSVEESVNMPLLIGKDIDEATKILSTIGLNFKISYSEKHYKDIGENCVYLQKPASGSKVKKGSVIELGVSTYKEKSNDEIITVPSLLKRNYVDATKILNDMGLSYTITYSDKQYVDIGENCVYSQKPASGTRTSKDTVIEIGISTYKLNSVTTTGYTVPKKQPEIITMPPKETDQSTETQTSSEAIAVSVFPNEEQQKKTYAVFFCIDDDTVIVEVNRGEDAVPPEVTAKPGYKFVKWDGNYKNVTDDRYVYAVFEKDDVPADTESGTAAMQPAPRFANFGDETLLLTYNSYNLDIIDPLPIDGTTWEDYIWESDNENSVQIISGILQTYMEGEATITLTYRYDTSKAVCAKIRVVTAINIVQ